MLLVLDNYDSFTYNLVQYLGILGAEMHVARNDEITVAEIEAMGAVFADRGGHLLRTDRTLRTEAAGVRRLPRTPEHRPGVWW